MLGWQLQTQSKQKLKQLTMVVLVPIVVLTLLLWAFWQPTARQHLLQVAVVNQDKTVKINGKQQQFGETLLTTLQKSQTLTFKTATAKQAQAGLKNGRYVAVITAPKTFSQAINQYAKTGQSAPLTVNFNSAQSPAQTQIAQTAIVKAINTLNAQLLTRSDSTAALQKSAKTSSSLSDTAKTLLGSVQSVNSQVPDNQTLQGIADDTSSYGTDLANLVSQLNTAIANDDQTQVSALAVKIQTIGYELQTSHQSAVNTLIAALQTIGSYTDAQSPLQQNAKALQSSNGSLATALTGTASDLTPKNTTAIVSLKTTDTMKVTALGAQILPALILGALVALSLLVLARYQVRISAWHEQLVLEQWWGHFQVLGAISGVSALVLLGIGTGFGWRGDWAWSGLAVVLYGWFAVSLVWLSKFLLGNYGLLVSAGLFSIDFLLSNAWYPAGLFSSWAQNVAELLPGNQMIAALRGVAPAHNVGVLAVWLLVVTALLLTFYRSEQKGRRVALVQ
ncbi:MAG TPA: YhgE/Pip family protein [Lactobacillaceae bacterium]|jgi:YhgE/Pip-like protein